MTTRISTTRGLWRWITSQNACAGMAASIPTTNHGVRCFMPRAPSWRAAGNVMRWDIPDAEPGGMLAVESAARAARARAGPSQLVMPLFSNAGFMPYLRNLLCSLQRLDVDNWFVIALDNETCPLLGATEGHCVHPYRRGGGGGSGAGSSGSGSRSRFLGLVHRAHPHRVAAVGGLGERVLVRA